MKVNKDGLVLLGVSGTIVKDQVVLLVSAWP